MTDKELRKLNRAALLELLVEQGRQLESLQERVKELEGQLASRELNLEETGSIAEAAIKVNEVFESAQRAADQYMENIKRKYRDQESVCARMEAETQEKCQKMVQEAEMKSKAYWETVSSQLEQFMQQHEGLKTLLSVNIPK